MELNDAIRKCLTSINQFSPSLNTKKKNNKKRNHSKERPSTKFRGTVFNVALNAGVRKICVFNKNHRLSLKLYLYILETLQDRPIVTNRKSTLIWSSATVIRKLTRSSADADNRRDAFSGQSRSTNMIPFWVHCDFSLSMWSAPRTTNSLRDFHSYHSSSVLWQRCNRPVHLSHAK